MLYLRLTSLGVVKPRLLSSLLACIGDLLHKGASPYSHWCNDGRWKEGQMLEEGRKRAKGAGLDMVFQEASARNEHKACPVWRRRSPGILRLEKLNVNMTPRSTRTMIPSHLRIVQPSTCHFGSAHASREPSSELPLPCVVDQWNWKLDPRLVLPPFSDYVFL